jgi:hypothetical protein
MIKIGRQITRMIIFRRTNLKIWMKTRTSFNHSKNIIATLSLSNKNQISLNQVKLFRRPKLKNI